MKISKQRLKQIIKEELEAVLEEDAISGAISGVSIVSVKQEGRYIVVTVKHGESGLTATGKGKLRGSNVNLAKSKAIKDAKIKIMQKLQGAKE